MSRSEKAILNEILVATSALPQTLVFRNNTGVAWQGKQHPAPVGSLIRVEPGMVVLKEARPIKFGLPGSSDIVGVRKGRGIAIEVKTDRGRLSENQENFGHAWVKAGGLFITARSVTEAISALS